jgi:integrase
MRQPFSLFPRKLPSGKKVYYYQTYDDKGNRTSLLSTGQKTKTAALAVCMERYKAGTLAPRRGEKRRSKIPTFAEFAEGWWDYDTCPYLQKRKARRRIAQGTADAGKGITRNRLLPKFGNRRLDEITAYEVDAWLTGFKACGLSNATGNSAFSFLRIMLGEAARQGIIKFNPCASVEFLPEESGEIEILTPEEAAKMFSADWRSIWDDETFYILNMTAACTGMRLGEILGLRGEYLFSGYIHVAGQFGKHGYGDTKTHKPRDIPVSPEIEAALGRLKARNGDSYLFSTDGGETPVGRKEVYGNLYAAFAKIGIDEEQRKKRRLSMHGWRHFFNTMLLTENVSDSMVMSMTGHVSEKQKNRYTNFDTTMFSEVVAAQKKLLGGAAKPPSGA